MKFIIKDTINDRKMKDIVSRYLKIATNNFNKTNKILMLVPNQRIKYKYEELIKLEESEEIKITTYMSFISKEIIKFWPIIDENCNLINNHTVKPYIIPNSLSDYIMNEIVKEKRNFENYFQDITASNRNISNSISYNINKSVQSLFNISDIGDKVYYSKSNRDKIDRYSYTQMQDIINEYLNMLLKSSMVDNSIKVYLYNEYLLKDEYYIKQLRDSIDYLIVDSLESMPICEIDFIDNLLDYVKESYMYINETKDYASFLNVDMTYIRSKLFKKCEIIKNDDISNIRIKDIAKLNVGIDLDESNQLYSEMIIQAANKVVELINKGHKAKDIAIISPNNNTILDYQIKSILQKNKISIYNTKQDKRIIDYPYAHALMVSACIFYECEELLNEEDYVNYISLLLDTNKIKSTKIFRNNDINEEYLDILNYIKNKKLEDINIYEFLIKFYIDKLLKLPAGKLNVKICKKIIQESESFTENVKILGFDKNKSKEKIFIEALKSSIKDYYSISDLDDFSSEDAVVLTTPYTYIAQNMKNPTQVCIDIGSNMWSMKCEREISNVQVFKKSFKDGEIYTDDIEEYYKEYYLYNTMYNLLLNTDKVYAYKSEYTVNGYIQEGMMYSLILKLIDKGEYYE